MLIPIGDIKYHLRLDEDPDLEIDSQLESMYAAAVDYASGYLGRTIPWSDENGDVVELPGSVRHAILLLIGDFFANREETVVGVSTSVSGHVERLLQFHRVGLGV